MKAINKISNKKGKAKVRQSSQSHYLNQSQPSQLSVTNAKVHCAFEDELELNKKCDAVSQKKLSVEVSRKVTQNQLRKKCDMLLDQLKKFSIGLESK